MIRRGDFNIGSLANVFLRVRCKTSAGLGASREMKIALADKRQCTFIGKHILLYTKIFHFYIHRYLRWWTGMFATNS